MLSIPYFCNEVFHRNCLIKFRTVRIHIYAVVLNNQFPYPYFFRLKHRVGLLPFTLSNYYPSSVSCVLLLIILCHWTCSRFLFKKTEEIVYFSQNLCNTSQVLDVQCPKDWSTSKSYSLCEFVDHFRILLAFGDRS